MTKNKLLKKYQKHLSDLERMQNIIDKMGTTEQQQRMNFKSEIRYVKTFIEDIKKIK